VDAATIIGWGFGSVWLVWVAALTVIDVSEHRLPDWLTLPAYPVATAWIATTSTGQIQPALATAIICIVGGFLAYRFADLGFGDVKLVGVVGILVGGSGEYLAALALGALIAGCHVVVFLIRTRDVRGYLPFGPSLLAATIPAVIALV
jgi:leader peptidase (prepilin peptidase)/N-methyltransferase